MSRAVARLVAGAGAAAALAAPPMAFAQASPAQVATLPVGGADNASIDAVISALYASISGDSGGARDWNRFRGLFHPSARLFQLPRAPRAGAGALLMTVEDYIGRAAPAMARVGFHEREVHRDSAALGRLVHVFSTYESKRSLSDPAPFDAGVNSIQLVSDGAKWWILHIGWQSETPAEPIPPKYRKRAGAGKV